MKHLLNLIKPASIKNILRAYSPGKQRPSHKRALPWCWARAYQMERNRRMAPTRPPALNVKGDAVHRSMNLVVTPIQPRKGRAPLSPQEPDSPGSPCSHSSSFSNKSSFSNGSHPGSSSIAVIGRRCSGREPVERTSPRRPNSNVSPGVHRRNSPAELRRHQIQSSHNATDEEGHVGPFPSSSLDQVAMSAPMSLDCAFSDDRTPHSHPEILWENDDMKDIISELSQFGRRLRTSGDDEGLC